jgi:hypothetical protein
MAVTSKLKPKIDLPVWEWMRPIPAGTATTNCTCSSFDGRYVYYIGTTSAFRYDTITDSWNQIASPFAITGQTLIRAKYTRSHGHYGRAISAGTGSNTIEMAALVAGDLLVGKTIKIISGKGVGQSRTITSVSEPIVRDRGVVTTASQVAIIDNTSTGLQAKTWGFNAYRDYQVRVLYGGAAASIVRPILYNNYNGIAFAELTWQSVTPWWGPYAPTTTSSTAGAQTMYQIESNMVTVDSNWTTTPDNTSNFVILSDGIWMFTNSTTAPFYAVQYYDVLTDTWYYKNSTGSNFTGIIGTDIAIEKIPESNTPILSGFVSTAGPRQFTITSPTLSANQYANFEVRVLSGTGVGQARSILANTSASFITTRPWDIQLDNTSLYGVYRDVDKIYVTGGGTSLWWQYDVETDQPLIGKRYDFGLSRTGSVSATNNFEPIPITGIARLATHVTGLATSPTVGGTGYAIGQILTITTGGTGATARITSVNSVGAVTGVTLEATGPFGGAGSYTTGSGKATTVVPTGGTGCTLNITSVGDVAMVNTSISNPYRIGDTISIVGSTIAAYNGNFTILGIPTPATTALNLYFAYAIAGSPATPATFNTNSTTTIFDVNKNWIVNEHVGKLVQITSAINAIQTTAVTRRITSNTATSLSWTTALAFTPSGSTSKYVIHDDKPFSTEQSLGSILGNGRNGIATGGSNTTLVDTTKNWPINYYSTTASRRVRILAGTGAGSELAILSNTSNTLTFASQAFAVDQTSVYVIMENFGVATATGLGSLTDSTQNWASNIHNGKRVRITSGTGQGQEVTIQSNTGTVLTLTANWGTQPDTASTYAILESPTKGAGIEMFNITNSTKTSLNDRYIYTFRGGATNEIGRYNINTEQYEPVYYSPLSETFTTGSMFQYDDADRIYIQKDSTGRIMYYDLAKNQIINSSTVPYGMGTAIVGNRMEVVRAEDDLKFLYVMRHSGQEFWRTLLFW